MSVEVAIKDAAKVLCEGPHWDPSTKKLLFVDIMGKSVHRFNPSTGLKEDIQLDRFVGFIVPAKNGGYIIGYGSSFAHLDWDSKKVTILHEVDQGMGHFVNDGKCDRRGRIWAGTVGPIEGGDILKLKPVGSLYCLDTDGKIHKRLENIRLSNGIAWNKDSSLMYYIDSLDRQVCAFDYNIETGEIANRKVVVDLTECPLPEIGMPDGMTTDMNDNIWVACMLAGKVAQFDSKTGKLLKSVELPAKRITSCCFGGNELNELYLTSAISKEAEEALQSPSAGSLFKVTGLGVTGLPASIYEGSLSSAL